MYWEEKAKHITNYNLYTLDSFMNAVNNYGN